MILPAYVERLMQNDLHSGVNSFFFLNLLLYNTPVKALWRRVSISENAGSTEHYAGEQETQDIELPLLTLPARDGKAIRYVMLTILK